MFPATQPVSPRHQRRGVVGFNLAIMDIIGGTKFVAKEQAALFQWYGRAQQQFSAVQAEFRRICMLFLHASPEPIALDTFRPTEFHGNEEQLYNQMKEAMLSAIAKYERELDKCGVGKIISSDNKSCTFNYTTFANKGGLFTRTIEATNHVHDLVRCRYHKHPFSGATLDKRAQQIVAEINLLRPITRVVTGELVTQDASYRGTIQERTAAGQVMDVVRDRAGRAARWARSESGRKAATVGAAGAGIGFAAWGITAGIAALSSAAAATAVVDPAIIVGDRVLYGWV